MAATQAGPSRNLRGESAVSTNSGPVMPTPSDGIRIVGASKSYPIAGKASGPLLVLDHLSLAVHQQEFVAILGPSGCGKSTLLRLVAALEAPDSGTVSIDGFAPASLAQSHRLGVAFQDHALLPWLSVEQNIALPFRIAGRAIDWARVRELTALVRLQGFEQARPRQLSGGMRQRASIARALALAPEVLLLDEPFGALDAVTRRAMNLELQRIWTERALTTLLVTHSVDEAVFLADRVVVMSGRPGSVVADVRVEFARPRDVSLMRTPAFHALVDQLTAELDMRAPSTLQ
jgi:NitT/TauT family transport system ATP-binding protein